MQTKHIPNISLCAVLLALLALSVMPPGAAFAQAGSAMDLVNAVNAYRTANGLQAYDVDGGLMSLAQQQSEYQASIEACTHQRADGSGPGAQGISAENIACGLNISVQDAIYSQWTDPTHSATLLGPTTGMVGAGMAQAGSTIYYTLAVKRLSGDFTYRPPQTNSNPAAGSSSASGSSAPASSSSASGSNPAAIPTPTLNPNGVVASTPGEDGSIAHIIKYGETLIQIADAYGISLADLESMNKLDPKNPQYFAGQALIIRNAFTLTPYYTATYTARPPTRTPQPSRTPRPTRTATGVHTPEPTWTKTPEPLVKLPTLEDLGPGRSIMAYSFIAISAVGLLVLVLTSFMPGRKE